MGAEIFGGPAVFFHSGGLGGLLYLEGNGGIFLNRVFAIFVAGIVTEKNPKAHGFGFLTAGAAKGFVPVQFAAGVAAKDAAAGKGLDDGRGVAVGVELLAEDVSHGWVLLYIN